MKVKSNKCPCCKVTKGQFHKPYCDMERCPFCGGQLISCRCCYKLLGFLYDYSAPFCGLPEKIYTKGLSNDLEKKWQILLNKKGRVPYTGD